jgi:hypothetical protein
LITRILSTSRLTFTFLHLQSAFSGHQDSWDADDDDDEKKDDEKVEVASKPKKTLQQKIAEKEVSCHFGEPD